MILYIFGQTFIALFNLPFKNFTLSEFNSSLRNPLYVIPLIGLRYSPRVILSCSGYTLMYKFLCFIEKERNFYLPKFFLIQSYKYILLIVFCQRIKNINQRFFNIKYFLRQKKVAYDNISYFVHEIIHLKYFSHF